MLINDLKLSILNKDKTITDAPLLFKWTDNKFLCYSYAKAIAANQGKVLMQIESLEEINNDSLFDLDVLYVLETNSFKDKVSNLKNLIVISKEIDSDIDFIEFAPLENWQIEDFVKSLVPGLTEASIKFLCETCKYDIYKISHEVDKLKIFLPQQQDILLHKLTNENNFYGLTSLNIFNFINAIVKKEYSVVQEVMSNLDIIDIEGTGVVTLLLKEFKKLIDIKLNKQEANKYSQKQLNFLKYVSNKYTADELINIYKFLTSIDQQLKQGYLQFASNNRINNKLLTEYIVCNILTMMN